MVVRPLIMLFGKYCRKSHHFLVVVSKVRFPSSCPLFYESYLF